MFMYIESSESNSLYVSAHKANKADLKPVVSTHIHFKYSLIHVRKTFILLQGLNLVKPNFELFKQQKHIKTFRNLLTCKCHVYRSLKHYNI